MDRDRPRWRFRISTLMLLVFIAALAAALFVEHRDRVRSEQRAVASQNRAIELEARLWKSVAAAEVASVQALELKAQLDASQAARTATAAQPGGGGKAKGE
jgi:hypothetical protein